VLTYADGWWKSEAAVGGGKEIVIHNYDRGYRAGSLLVYQASTY
jgi:hypothetical protein